MVARTRRPGRRAVFFRRVLVSGTLTTIAGRPLQFGIPQRGSQGTGGPAVAAFLNVPTQLSLAPTGDLYFSDAGNGLVRRIATGFPIPGLTGYLLPSDDGRQAFANLWQQQMRTGDLSGAWAWLRFGLEPWEGANSAYLGAALAAVAVGTAPGDYASNPEIEKNVELLRTYLTKQAGDQPALNKMMLLWAASKLPGLLSASERDALVTEVLAKQVTEPAPRRPSVT